MKCILCEQPMEYGLPYCRTCFKNYETDIKTNARWIRAIETAVQRNTRYYRKYPDMLSLDLIAEMEYKLE